jgi:hypothetical protein
MTMTTQAVISVFGNATTLVETITVASDGNQTRTTIGEVQGNGCLQTCLAEGLHLFLTELPTVPVATTAQQPASTDQPADAPSAAS